MHDTTRRALALTAALGALLPSVRAQETTSQEDPAATWAAQAAGEDGVLDADELERVLARIEVGVAARRELALGAARLAALRALAEARVAAEPGNADAREVLARALAAQAEAALARGEARAALAYVAAVEESAALDLQLVARDPRVIAAAERARAAVRQVVGAADGDPLEVAVARALASGDMEMLKSLWTAAVPTLDALVAAHPDSVYPTGLDPLQALVWLDPAAAVERMTESYGAGGIVWKARMANALVPLWDLTLWKREQMGFADAACALATRLIEDPEASRPALDALDRAPRNPWLREPLLSALARVAREGGIAAKIAARVLQRCEFGPQVEAALVEALRSPDVEVRGRAAAPLKSNGFFEHPSETLFACAADPSPEIRGLVAERLRRPRDPREQAALERLLSDPDAKVRKEAFEAIREPHTVVPADRDQVQVPRALQPPSREVLLELARGEDTQELLQKELLPRLDSEARLACIAEMVDARLLGDLADLLLQTKVDDVERYFEVVEALLARAPELSENTTWRGAVESWKQDPREWPAAVALATRTAHAGLLSRMVQVTGAHIEDLDAAQWIGLLRAVVRSGLPGEFMERMIAERPAGVARELVALARDASVAPVPRQLAALAALADGAAEAAEPFRQGLHDPDFLHHTAEDTLRRRSSEYELGQRLWRSVPSELRNAVCVELLADHAVQEEAAATFTARFTADDATGVQVGRAILSRWSDALASEGPNVPALSAALQAMGGGALRDDAVLGRALQSRLYYPAALEAIEALQDPAHEPLLLEFLRTSSDVNWRPRALSVLAGYADEGAVDALIRIATTSPRESERELCVHHLDRIRQLEAARDFARRLRSEGAARDRAVHELLELLEDDDADVAAQAARGLARLQAVDALPALVRRMKTAPPELRAALQETLERWDRPGQGD